MEYDLGVIQFKDHTETLNHTNVTDHRNEVYPWIFLLELQTDVMKWALCRIKQYQFTDTDLGQLSAKFTPDTAGSSGDKNSLIAIFRCDFPHVDFDFLAPQKIFNTDGTDELMKRTIDIRLTDGGSDQSLHANALTIFKKAVLFFFDGIVAGEKNALYTGLLN